MEHGGRPDACAVSRTDCAPDYVRDVVSWAPDSRTLAYANGSASENGDVFAVALSAGTASGVPNLTQSIQVPAAFSQKFYMDDGMRAERFRFMGGAPLWSADGQAILRVAAGDVWYLPVQGTGGAAI